MSQFTDLEDNIDGLNEVCLALCEKTKPLDLTKYMLTNRQMIKKMMEAASPDKSEEVKKRIHIIVYGKYEVDGNGKLVDNEDKYPWCVDDKRSIKLTHPLFKEVKKMWKELKTSFRMIGIKRDQLKEAFKFAGKQIDNAGLVAADAAAPPSPKIKVGIAAVQGVVTAIQDLQYKVLEILPILGPLINIPLLIVEAAIDIILSVVNGILTILIAIIGTIATLKNTIMPIIKGLQALGAA